MITYPLTLPPKIAHVKLTGVSTAGLNISPYTRSQEVFKWPGECWMLEAVLASQKRADFAAWQAFLLALRGPFGTFQWGDPNGKTPRGSFAGSPVIDGAQIAGLETVALRGFTPGAAGVALPGDWIQLPNTRLHMITTPTAINADSSGKATLDIFPRTRDAQGDGAAVVTSNCVGLFRLMDGAQAGWDLDPARVYDASFKAMEVLP